jgi:excisionase family DNA binding protein
MKHHLLSVSEAARLKGVTRSAVYSAVARGVLPHQIVLGHIALRESDVKAWIAARVTAGRPAGTRLSKAAKERISQANKNHWARRKKQAAKAVR